MLIRCIDCQHMASDKDQKSRSAQAGLVRCSVIHDPTGVYKTTTYQRNCPSFSRADDSVIKTREAWFKKFEWSPDDSTGN